MWGQWKDKLMDLFTTEVEVEEEEEIEPRKYKKKSGSMPKNEELETKVMYQYPEKNEFRFPVIPDRVEQKKPAADAPAYQRRKQDEFKREQRKPKANYERKKYSATAYEKPKKSNEKKVPFSVTQVPSPIHGFQKQKKPKEIDDVDVPAFVRKQQTEDTQMEEIEQLVTERPNEVESEELDQPLNQDEQSKETIEEEYNAPIEKTETPQPEPVRKEKRNPITNSTKKEGSLPFNVMMSSNDKRKHEMFRARTKQIAATEEPKQEAKVAPVSELKMGKVEQTTASHEIPNYLLNDPVPRDNHDQLWVREQQELLEKTLKHFNVRAKVVNATQGPAVTRFEVQPEIGVKVSKVKNLSDDLKLNMAARDIRIEAPIPGKNTIGIEIPNQTSQMVGLQEIFETNAFKDSPSPLTVGLGLDIEGTPMVTNIQKMPHGLIAGATGSGKSVCINTILISLLYKASHEDVKFLLIDPKMVELAPFNEIPHLVSPVITDVKAATIALKWAVDEMEERYEKFVHEGVRDVERFNQKMIKQGRLEEKLPFLVIVIDELADLMMAAPQDVEDSICRIAQKARACGMHLLVATQRPSVDVITGLIKANIPTRIAFSVSSQVDSRTIIDTNGAEKLLGKGDMLFVENGSGKSVRLQGAFVSDDEIERVTKHIRSIAPPNYLFEQEQLLEQVMVDEADEDDLLAEAIDFVVKQNGASTSLLQRHFKIGYNRAARLMDTMETRGIISGQNGSKPREVLLSAQQLDSSGTEN